MAYQGPYPDRFGRVALHYAVGDGDATALREALAAGTDPNAIDHSGWTALHFAAQAQDPQAAQVLLSAGATVDAADEHGNTPLWRAVSKYRGDPATVKALLAAGADPGQRNRHGVSPYELAQRIANYDVKLQLPALRQDP